MRFFETNIATNPLRFQHCTEKESNPVARSERSMVEVDVDADESAASTTVTGLRLRLRLRLVLVAVVTIPYLLLGAVADVV